MTAAPDNEIPNVEKRSLTVGKWANLVMAVAGVGAAWASHSDALLVDGLYSGVNFLSAVVATRVGMAVARQPDARRPFGYEADEALYVTFRSMTLIGILAFAMFTAVTKILTYWAGGDVPALNFGPIQVYVLAMVAICAWLAYRHHRAYVETGRTSELLLTERRAAIIDGVLSAGAGVALLLIPFLQGTALEGIVPVADAVVVLIMAGAIIAQPIGAFRRALAEIAGESAAGEKVESVRKALLGSLEGQDVEVVDLAVTKLGRRYTAVGYLKPAEATTAAQVDALNAAFQARCLDVLGDVRSEIVLTETARQA